MTLQLFTNVSDKFTYSLLPITYYLIYFLRKRFYRLTARFSVAAQRHKASELIKAAERVQRRAEVFRAQSVGLQLFKYLGQGYGVAVINLPEQPNIRLACGQQDSIFLYWNISADFCRSDDKIAVQKLACPARDYSRSAELGKRHPANSVVGEKVEGHGNGISAELKRLKQKVGRVRLGVENPKL